MNEYCAIQPLVKIAAEVNVFDRPDRWLEVKERFDLDASQVNRFLFFAGGSKELRQAVTPQDLAAFGPSRDPAIAVPKIKAFRGEEAITTAITRLIERRKRPVYFTQGHGELALRPEEARAAGPAGLSAFLHELKTEGLEPRELSFGISREVPDDCALLVVAAPDQAYSREDLGAIDRYLQRGGKLFAALGPARGTAFDDLLAAWGARALEGRLEARKSLPGGGHIYVPRVPVRAFHKAHPVTRVFESVPRFEMYLENARPIASGGAEKGLESTPLIEVVSREGEGYYLVSDRKDPELPKPGDFELAVAVEQRAPERPPPGFRRLGTRIVVAGSPSFLRDQSFLTGSHRDFTMNCIAWLLGEEDRVTVGGQEWAERMIKASPGIQRFLFWVPVFLLPGIFLCMGAFVYYLRRA